MSIHVYHCSVCQGHFGTRKEWLSHLLKDYHQDKARKEISRWGQPERECVLVAFATSRIASFDLLQFFSKGSNNLVLVTDFVWFPNRPELGFLQFESKHNVEEILSSFGGPQVRVDNQLVQVKRAGECLGFEWQLLMKLNSSATGDEEFENIPDLDALKSIPPPPPDIVSSSLNNAFVEETCNDFKRQQSQNSPQQVPQEGETDSLVDEYHSIFQEMEIPDEEFKTAQEFLEMFETLLSKQFPSCKLIWFRNWYLKLKNPSEQNDLVFFLDLTGIYTTCSATTDTKKTPKVSVLLLKRP